MTHRPTVPKPTSQIRSGFTARPAGIASAKPDGSRRRRTAASRSIRRGHGQAIVAAGAPVRKGKRSGVWVTHQKMRHAEMQLAAQAQASYERTVRD
jgi:hypothetical protein